MRVLSYHGKSIDDFVATLRSVSIQPERAMQAMLERRHLAPSWGGKTPLSPEPEDNLVISTVPDIFVTGHVHGHFVGNYKGTTMVHSSTWQNQTDFQRMLGFQPKPCILTVVNLHICDRVYSIRLVSLRKFFAIKYVGPYVPKVLTFYYGHSGF